MTKSVTKLPKHIIMMVEKGNLVSAIKNLSAEESISMDEAKDRIDAYEQQLKRKQQQAQQQIAQGQNKANKSNFVKIIIGLGIIVLTIMMVLWITR